MKKSTNASLFNTTDSPPRRLQQVASLFQHELAVLLVREVELPRGVLPTLTKVEVLADFSAVRVGVSILPFERRQVIVDFLIKISGYLQHLMGKKLTLYRIPKIEFYLDETAERALGLEHLLDTVKEKE